MCVNGNGRGLYLMIDSGADDNCAPPWFASVMALEATGVQWRGVQGGCEPLGTGAAALEREWMEFYFVQDLACQGVCAEDSAVRVCSRGW